MKRSKLIILCFGAIISAIITGCLNHSLISGVQGSGKIKTESREVENFSSILLKGSAHIYLSQAESFSVKIESDDNIIPVIETKVIKSQLIISNKESINASQLNIYISMPKLENYTVEGSGKLIGNNQLKCDKLSLNIDGSGEISLDLLAKDVDLLISGSGDAKFAGQCENFKINIDGSGDVKALDMATKTSYYQINGSGNIIGFVNETLSAEINGSGDISYKGSPQILKSKKSGSGKIRQIN